MKNPSRGFTDPDWFMNFPDRLYEYLIDKCSMERTNWANIILDTWGWFGEWKYRILIRGKCAIVGCDIKRASSYNLPEDVTHWYCDRCGIEGMNWQAWGRGETFPYEGKWKDFLSALGGE